MENTKICIDCKLEKNVGEFYKSSIHSLGVMVYCKACFIKRCIARWVERKIDAINYKGGCCERCNLSLADSHYSVFEFHHIDPSTKDYDWNKLKLRSLQSIHHELDKCSVLCANCHRIIHAELKLVETMGVKPITSD